MNQKAEQKQRSREAILNSAAVLIRGRGIRASSVGDVMKGAGLTVGGFYGHFGSKEELFAEIIRSTADSTWKQLFSGVLGKSRSQRARSIIERYLSPDHRDNVETGCLLPNTVPEVSHEGEPYQAALNDKLRDFAAEVSKAVGPGAEREEALAMIALMYGALSLSRAVAGTPLSDELLDAAKKLGDRMVSDSAS